MKIILGTLAAAVLASVAFAQPAEARCAWNGFAWQCWGGPRYGGWERHHHWRDHDHWRGGWHDRDWRDWR